MNNAERSLLQTILRARPKTDAEIASITEHAPESVAALLDGLEQAGFIHRDGHRIHYLEPDRRIAEYVTSLVDRQEKRMSEEFKEIRRQMNDLPDLVRDWAVGAATQADALPVEVVHGPDAGTELWRRQVYRGQPLFAEAVLPDLHRFQLPDVDEQRRFVDNVASDGRRVRAIVAASETETASIKEQLRRFHSAGIEIRMHAKLPSWFWIHDDHTVGLPLDWGEAWPTSVMAVRSAPIAAALRTLFDRLWDESQPAVGSEHNWTPLLRLMRTGATLDAASRWLGIGPRTGRRRIAAAMNHYGAQTLFGLGVAWEASGDSGGPKPKTGRLQGPL